MAQAKKAAKSSKPEAESKKIKETKEKQVKHGEIVAEAVAPEKAPKAEIEVEKVTAKAGKRSAKSQKEVEEKQAKETRKAKTSTEVAPSKPVAKQPRTKTERAGKKYREAIKLIDKSKTYPLADAVDLATKTSTTKFDASVELHVNLGVDPRQADQNVRDNVVLPAGTGKTVRIAVLAEDDDAAKAKTAGAGITGVDEIFAKLDKEELDFDVLIATPALMPRLGKYARLLGPRGLMPNPKSGTVSQDPAAAVTEAKAGKVEYRVDQSGIVHLSIGKVSFGAEKLVQNAEAVLASIRAAKPASLKGIYIKSIYLTSTMGPSIKVSL
ncbi:50S ribosomal protein L1 [Candidatus Saccharibacteria bacterium]|nr:50S ribosomal protein L1 [Candidatus Saccharibacteria bacterium]